jgi:hypothetical protein
MQRAAQRTFKRWPEAPVGWQIQCSPNIRADIFERHRLAVRLDCVEQR